MVIFISFILNYINYIVNGDSSYQSSHFINNWYSLSADGLHPNSAGYAKMAQVWFDAMKPIDLTPIYLLLLDE